MAQDIAAFFLFPNSLFFEMPSTADICKRALVTLIRSLAVAYGFRVVVTPDATDQVIMRAYHTTSKRVHPDRGGSTEDQKKLNSALCSHARPPARPPRERARSLRGKSVGFSGRTAVPIVRTGFTESTKTDFIVQQVHRGGAFKIPPTPLRILATFFGHGLRGAG